VAHRSAHSASLPKLVRPAAVSLALAQAGQRLAGRRAQAAQAGWLSKVQASWKAAQLAQLERSSNWPRQATKPIDARN
jgi:hypothetical protein